MKLHNEYNNCQTYGVIASAMMGEKGKLSSATKEAPIFPHPEHVPGGRHVCGVAPWHPITTGPGERCC